ncbi:alpha/beta fold hydrolase [Haloechinothrix sp. LS1_15]|uniref:alpha/beta fold hydrolase n=1 Tax=Haloechinothrix sp. LS1_15 TaxID=2652248 RepID=UPI00294850DC|nr:alpha/beta hydrolase [Haloechinothrix sp. LS1_15]MDV6011747.1 alpha/beta fold hydrolase [Haloechinothrix sp. LS1_15]
MPAHRGIVLVHSPLLGPCSWEPVALVLRQRGFTTAVPSMIDAVGGEPPYYPAMAGTVATRIIDEFAATGVTEIPPAEVLLVGHSGAGALLPTIAGAYGGTVSGAVYVDALLPHPGRSWFDTAPVELAEGLRQLTVDGYLPPWHEWFPPEMLDPLLPGGTLRDRFLAEIPALPLAYFHERAPHDPPLPQRHCTYVQLSEGYRDASVAAERRGWIVFRTNADHLALLTQPETVADLVESAMVAMAGDEASGK